MHTMTPQEAALTRGDIQMARKEYTQAVAEYKIALKGNAKDALLLNKMGIAYQQLGDLNDAERSYKKAMKADKKFASAMNNLGTLEYQRKRYGTAIKYYKEGSEARRANRYGLQQSWLRLLRQQAISRSDGCFRQGPGS